MKILVTGASGYLGKGIVDYLIKWGGDVVAASTDFQEDGFMSGATCIEGNIFEVENPYEFYQKPDVVLHLAWRDGFVHYSDAHIENLPKHYQFIKKLIESGLPRLAVMGSMHEVGFFEGSIKDDSPCRPLSLYGISKNALRDMTFMLSKNCGGKTCIQWLRGFYIVGSSKAGNLQKGSSVFSKIALASETGEREFPFTLGENQYDFMEYDDFCRCVAATVMQKQINGIINICSGKPEKLADRVERFISQNHYGIKLKYGAFPDRPYDSKAVWGDSKKIEAIMDRMFER